MTVADNNHEGFINSNIPPLPEDPAEGIFLLLEIYEQVSKLLTTKELKWLNHYAQPFKIAKESPLPCKWLIDRIYIENDDGEDVTHLYSVEGKVSYVMEHISIECFDMHPQLPWERSMLRNYVAGLPSYLNIPYINTEIIDVVPKAWGLLTPEIGNKSENWLFLEEYFTYIATILQRVFATVLNKKFVYSSNGILVIKDIE